MTANFEENKKAENRFFHGIFFMLSNIQCHQYAFREDHEIYQNDTD
jgi:hypothetical protein